VEVEALIGNQWAVIELKYTLYLKEKTFSLTLLFWGRDTRYEAQ